MIAESQNYYFAELMRGLHRISRVVAKLRLGAEKGVSLQRISESFRNIRDLAMIHGYEGVEKLASKIDAELKVKAADCPAPTAGLLDQITAAIVAIKQIAGFEEAMESQLTVDRIDWKAELLRVQRGAALVAGEAEWMRHQQLDLFQRPALFTIPKPTDAAFEICECDSLLELSAAETALHNATLDLFA